MPCGSSYMMGNLLFFPSCPSSPLCPPSHHSSNLPIPCPDHFHNTQKAIEDDLCKGGGRGVFESVWLPFFSTFLISATAPLSRLISFPLRPPADRRSFQNFLSRLRGEPHSFATAIPPARDNLAFRFSRSSLRSYFALSSLLLAIYAII